MAGTRGQDKTIVCYEKDVLTGHIRVIVFRCAGGCTAAACIFGQYGIAAKYACDHMGMGGSRRKGDGPSASAIQDRKGG